MKTRAQPGYEPVGVRAGSWMFVPSLTTESRYDSNVFATPTNKQSDIAVRTHPSLLAYTLWDRHSLAVQTDVRTANYRRNPGLDWVDASVKATGRIDLRHDMAILTNFRVARLHDEVGSLSSPAGAVQPTPFDFATGDATYWQQFNRLSVSAGMRVDSYSYGTTRAQNGAIIDQSARDGQIYTGHGRVEYVVAPKFGVFGAVEGNRRDLRGTPAQPLGSEGYRALAGVNVEFSRLLTGEIGVGYADQQFDAATIGRIAGPAYRALLTWSPTRTIDVKLRAESLVTQAVDTGSTGIRADAVSLGVDYEFRRNVIVSLGVVYENDRFFGAPRTDKVFGTVAEIKYLLNRHWSVSLRHHYTNRNSDVPTFDYDKHEIGINLAAQF